MYFTELILWLIQSGMSLSIWIIHIIINLLISRYLEPLFHKTWTENLVQPLKRFTKQQDEAAAQYKWEQIEVLVLHLFREPSPDIKSKKNKKTGYLKYI